MILCGLCLFVVMVLLLTLYLPSSSDGSSDSREKLKMNPKSNGVILKSEERDTRQQNSNVNKHSENPGGEMDDLLKQRDTLLSQLDSINEQVAKFDLPGKFGTAKNRFDEVRSKRDAFKKAPPSLKEIKEGLEMRGESSEHFDKEMKQRLKAKQSQRRKRNKQKMAEIAERNPSLKAKLESKKQQNVFNLQDVGMTIFLSFLPLSPPLLHVQPTIIKEGDEPTRRRPKRKQPKTKRKRKEEQQLTLSSNTTTTTSTSSIESPPPPRVRAGWPNDPLPDDLSSIRHEIILEFYHAWMGYKKCAWGHDGLLPLSCKGEDGGFNMGLTIVDSLDTLILMHVYDGQEFGDVLLDEINSAKSWIEENLHFEHRDISLFESTIRILGGLLSSYHLMNDTILLDKAVDIANRLTVAYRPNGLPMATINLDKNTAYNPSWASGSLSTSEGATLGLENVYLSHLTGDPKYARNALKAQKMIIDAMKKASPPLMRQWIRDGGFTDSTMTLGGRIDSAYEYILKVALQLDDENLFSTWISSVENMEKHLFERSYPSHFLTAVQKSGNKGRTTQFDHLVCFIGGSLALGSVKMQKKKHVDASKHLKFGEEFTETCASLYFENDAMGLAPEIVYFNLEGGKDKEGKDFTIHARDKHSLLRPEAVESMFYLWRITHDEKYRKWGYQIFKNFVKWAKIDSGGYSSIKDVTKRIKDPFNYRVSYFLFFFSHVCMGYLLIC